MDCSISDQLVEILLFYLGQNWGQVRRTLLILSILAHCVPQVCTVDLDNLKLLSSSPET